MPIYIKRIIALICACTLLSAFTACNGGNKESNNNDEVVYHTITFDTNGGTPVESMEVRHGSHAHEPELPVLENYIFCSWRMPDGRTWFFDSKSVTEDVSLEAVWIKADDLFELAPMPDSDGIMITKIRRQEEFALLKIPSVINGKTVVGISEGAFSSLHKRYATSILFPDTLTYIGEQAFAVNNEVSLTFTGEVSYLGEEAFKNNTMLTEIALCEGLEKIPFCAFMGCTSLKTLDIPEGVITIEENAFEDCVAMRTIVLPSTLTLVESGAFKDCDNLKSVFFRGSEEQFDSLEIDGENNCLEDAKIYFYSEEEPTEDGMFWHYGKNNTPVIW